jgi:hypothetical protein
VAVLAITTHRTALSRAAPVEERRVAAPHQKEINMLDLILATATWPPALVQAALYALLVLAMWAGT